MNSLFFHAPLSAPAEFAGTVDASSERSTPCPRTLHQAFGEHAEHCHIVPMDSSPSSHPAERIFAVVGGVAIVVFLIAEKAGWL